MLKLVFATNEKLKSLRVGSLANPSKTSKSEGKRELEPKIRPSGAEGNVIIGKGGLAEETVQATLAESVRVYRNRVLGPRQVLPLCVR